MVTVCYNCVNEIENTILSVVHQSFFDRIEYIVVDGKSTDGTCDIISKYKNKIDTIISEPDKGVYYAMNKGIIASNADFIIFMNAGDCFYNDSVCADTAQKIMKDNKISDVYYGDVVRKKKNSQRTLLAESVSLLRYRMPFSHQSCFIKKTVMESLLYDTSYKIAADFNLFHFLYVNNKSFSNLKLIVSVFEAENGISSKKYLTSIQEVNRVLYNCKAPTWFVDIAINTIRGYLIYIINHLRTLYKKIK